MRLSEFLRPRGRLTAFAAQIGKPVQTVHSWKEGRRSPSIADALLIEKATNGVVTMAELAGDRREPAA